MSLPRGLALAVVGLSLVAGYLGGGWMRPVTGDAEVVAPREGAESRRLAERIRGLESEIQTLQNQPAVQLEPTAAAPAAKPVVLSRIDQVRQFRTAGAAVSMRLFTGQTSTIAPAAKAFFHLADDEAAKISAAFDRAKKASDEGATANAAVTRSDSASLTIVVPAFDGANGIYSQFTSDVEQAIGPERATELLEIGQDDFKGVLNNAGTGERTITITRVVRQALTNGTMTKQFQMTEPIARGMRMGMFDSPAENEAFRWLARFEDQMNGLTPKGQ